MIHRALVIPLLGMMALLASCSDHHNAYLKQKIGTRVSVEFKRNALGCAANLPVPPTTGTINGADVVQSGTLERVESRAIVISDDHASYWIPMDAILTVTCSK
jgi:hypothetical protein